jgi:hypothetical protein
LSTAIFEPGNNLIAKVSLVGVDDISCSVYVNSVINDVDCYYNILDGNIYIQKFQLSQGSNNIVLTILNLRNYKDSSFVGEYTMRILEGTTGSLIYQFNQVTAINSNFAQLYYKNNHLSILDESNALVDSIFQCKNVFGPQLNIRDSNGLVIKIELFIFS